MGAAASITLPEAFNNLSDEDKASLQTKFDGIVATGKTEQQALDMILVEDCLTKGLSLGLEGDAKKCEWEDVCAPDMIVIRPTGNPMGQNTWKSMMSGEDVKATFNNLLSFEKLDISDDCTMAWAIYTNHAQFVYKGTENDDVAVFTSICKKIDGTWKIVCSQRSTGRKPDEERPNFAEVN
jgi:ketosteroid isomerase-like protein